MKIKGQQSESRNLNRWPVFLWGWLGAAYRIWTETVEGSTPSSSTIKTAPSVAGNCGSKRVLGLSQGPGLHPLSFGSVGPKKARPK